MTAPQAAAEPTGRRDRQRQATRKRILEGRTGVRTGCPSRGRTAHCFGHLLAARPARCSGQVSIKQIGFIDYMPDMRNAEGEWS